MKKYKSLLILLGVLVLLGGSYFGITRYQSNKSAQKAAQEKAESEANQIKYTSFDSVTSISTNVSGETLSFSLKDDNWVYDGDNAFPLTQSYLTTMADDLCYSVATRQLEEPDALADYGLENPQYTITASDGTTTTNIYIGNTTDDGYYMTVDDTGNVYTIGSSLVDDTGKALTDMITMDTFPGFTSSNVTKVDILTAGGGETVYTSEDNADDITAIAGGLGAFTCTDYAGYFGDNDQTKLAQYGLDDGSATMVQITYTKTSDTTDSTAEDTTDTSSNSEDTSTDTTSSSSDETSATDDTSTTTTETYTMYIGSQDEAGENYYVRVQDSNLIYTGSTEIINNILNQ